MSIVIEPKNIFDKAVERNNDNVINTAGYSAQTLETTYNNIFGDGVYFYTEKEIQSGGNTIYKYVLVDNDGWEYINVEPSNVNPEITGTGVNILQWDTNRMPNYNETYAKGTSVNIPLSNYWIESSPNYTIRNNMYSGVYKNGSLIWTAEDHSGNTNYTFDSLGAYEIVTFVPFTSNGTDYSVSFSWSVGIAEDTTRIIAYKKIEYSVGENEHDAVISSLKGNFVYSDKTSIETQDQATTQDKYLTGYVVGVDSVTESNINEKIIEAADINQQNSYGCGALLDRSTIDGEGFVIYVFFTIHYIENFYIHRYLTATNDTHLNVQEYVLKGQDNVANNSDYTINTNELLINYTNASTNPIKQQVEELTDKIEYNYSSGKSTMVLNCSIDNYYEGIWDETKQEYVSDITQKVISKNGSDNLPMYFKNNDIVIPKRVKMVRSGNEMVQQPCDLIAGKKFRVVGVKVKYDGCVMQELTLQEEKD